MFDLHFGHNLLLEYSRAITLEKIAGSLVCDTVTGWHCLYQPATVTMVKIGAALLVLLLGVATNADTVPGGVVDGAHVQPRSNGDLLVPLDALSENDVAALLRLWRVDKSFSELFSMFQVDGLALSFVDLNDSSSCESGTWLLHPSESHQPTLSRASPAPLMWKKLCALLRRTVDAGGVLRSTLATLPTSSLPSTSTPTSPSSTLGSQRRLLSSLVEEIIPDIDEYSGVRVSNNKSVVQLGESGDVTIARSDLAELLILAHRTVFHGDVHINGTLHVNGNVSVNGERLASDDDADCSATFLNCQEAYEAGCPAGVFSVFPDGYTGASAFEVRCRHVHELTWP